MLGARRIMVPANGIEIEVFEAGAGDRLALLLGGFPEHAIQWRHIVGPLVEMGYRVWAVNQRGYGATTRPPERSAYSLDALTGDVAGLIDAAAAKSVTLIAHDWGGFIAWTVAIRRLRPLEKLVFLNIPHPRCYLAALRGWRQALKAYYVLLIQIPWLTDWLMTRNRAAFPAYVIRSGVHRANPIPEAAIEIYRDNIAAPGAATAMLNWYRVAAPQLFLAKDLERPVETPILMIWGTADLALDESCLDGTERYATNLRIERLRKTTHWTAEDAPDKVVALLRSFL